MNETHALIVVICLVLIAAVEVFFAVLVISAIVKAKRMQQRVCSVLEMAGILGLGGAKFAVSLLGLVASMFIGKKK